METAKVESVIKFMAEDMHHESKDPICFPPLLHRIRQAEIQVKRAEALSLLAGKSKDLTSQDKADVLDSLQSARGMKSDAQRDLQQFLKRVGPDKAKYYLSLASKLQSSRRRSLELRRWVREGVLLEGDPCYQNLMARSRAFVDKSTRAASLLAVIEQEARAVPLDTVPEEAAQKQGQEKEGEADE